MAKKKTPPISQDLANVGSNVSLPSAFGLPFGGTNQPGVDPTRVGDIPIATTLTPDEVEHLEREGQEIAATGDAIQTIISSKINGVLAKTGNVVNELAGVQNGKFKEVIDAADLLVGDFTQQSNVTFANDLGGIREALSPFPIPSPTLAASTSDTFVPSEDLSGIRREQSESKSLSQATGKGGIQSGEIQTGGSVRQRSPTTGFLVGKGGLIPRYGKGDDGSNVRQSRATKSQKARATSKKDSPSDAEQIQSAQREEKETIQRTQSVLSNVANSIPWKQLGFASAPTSDIGQLAAHFSNLGMQLQNIVQQGGSNDTHYIDPLTGEVKAIGTPSTMEMLVQGNRANAERFKDREGEVIAEDSNCKWVISGGTPICLPKTIVNDAERNDAVLPVPSTQQITPQQATPIRDATGNVVAYTCPPCPKCPEKHSDCKYDIRKHSPDKTTCTPANQPNVATDWRAYQRSTTTIRNSSSEGPEDNPTPARSNSVYLSAPGQSALSPLDSLLAADSDKDCVQAAVDEMGLSNKPKESESSNPALKPQAVDLQTSVICEAVKGVDSIFKTNIKTELEKTLKQLFQLPADGFLDGDSFVSNVAMEIVSGLGGVASRIGLQVISFIEHSLEKTGCSLTPVANGTIALSIMGFLEQWLGVDLDPVQKPIKQGVNFFCPMDLPSPDNAIEAMLANKIDRSLYECWVKAGGQNLANWDKLLQSRRSKFSLLDYTMLYKRGTISASDLKSIARELGFLNDVDIEHSFELFHQLPPISDIIRFMVRDADDTRIAEHFGLDDGFTDKYQDQLRTWGEQQGIDDKTALYNWRSHWSIPSPTQLYEIFHRFRTPGIPFENDPLFQDVKQALIQQDILPFWIKHLLDASFKPINRTDLVRAVDVGVMNKPQAFKAFVELGYTDNVAQTLAEATFAQLKRKFQRNRYVRAYGNNLISRQTAKEALQFYAVPDDIIDAILDSGRADREQKLKNACIRGYKRRYKLGEFDNQDARQRLTDLGLDLDQVDNELRAWECEQSSAGKNIAGGTLCKWLGQGLLTANEFMDRSKRLGYSAFESLRLLSSCEMGIKARDKAAAERKAKLQLSQEEKERREIAKAAANEKRATEKQRAAMEKARKAKDRRIDLEFGAAEAWKKASGLEIGPALREVQDTTNRVAVALSGDWDAAIRAVTLAAETASKPATQPLLELVGPILEA